MTRFACELSKMLCWCFRQDSTDAVFSGA